jgi:hypothetical protein
MGTLLLIAVLAAPQPKINVDDIPSHERHMLEAAEGERIKRLKDPRTSAKQKQALRKFELLVLPDAFSVQATRGTFCRIREDCVASVKPEGSPDVVRVRARQGAPVRQVVKRQPAGWFDDRGRSGLIVTGENAANKYLEPLQCEGHLQGGVTFRIVPTPDDFSAKWKAVSEWMEAHPQKEH